MEAVEVAETIAADIANKRMLQVYEEVIHDTADKNSRLLARYNDSMEEYKVKYSYPLLACDV